MTTSCTEHEHPYYEYYFKKTFDRKKKLDFFLDEKNRHHMRFVSLGEAFDFISIGGGNFVWWDLSIKGMVNFVQEWMKEQKPKIHYKKVPLSEHSYTYKEIKREHFYRWNSFDHDWDEKLPYINRDSCDVEGHKRTIRDMGGKLRCAHIDVKHFKPSFLEQHVNFDGTISFLENVPFCSIGEPDYNEDGTLSEVDQQLLDKYEREMEKYEEEESVAIDHPCYDIISDVGTYLPLETVLDRLNVRGMGIGSSDKEEGCAFPFSGFTVAGYVKAWFNQEGERKLFRPDGTVDNYRHFSGFQAMSSDD